MASTDACLTVATTLTSKSNTITPEDATDAVASVATTALRPLPPLPSPPPPSGNTGLEVLDARAPTGVGAVDDVADAAGSAEADLCVFVVLDATNVTGCCDVVDPTGSGGAPPTLLLLPTVLIRRSLLDEQMHPPASKCQHNFLARTCAITFFRILTQTCSSLSLKSM